MINLPDFDGDAVCSKCRGDDIYTRWCKQGNQVSWRSAELCRWQFRDVEHMHRFCRSCGFEWLEATADVEQQG